MGRIDPFSKVKEVIKNGGWRLLLEKNYNPAGIEQVSKLRFLALA